MFWLIDVDVSENISPTANRNPPIKHAMCTANTGLVQFICSDTDNSTCFLWTAGARFISTNCIYHLSIPQIILHTSLYIAGKPGQIIIHMCRSTKFRSDQNRTIKTYRRRKKKKKTFSFRSSDNVQPLITTNPCCKEVIMVLLSSNILFCVLLSGEWQKDRKVTWWQMYSEHLVLHRQCVTWHLTILPKTITVTLTDHSAHHS